MYFVCEEDKLLKTFDGFVLIFLAIINAKLPIHEQNLFRYIRLLIALGIIYIF